MSGLTKNPTKSVSVDIHVWHYYTGTVVTLKITNSEGWHRTARTDDARVIESLEEILSSLSGAIQQAVNEYDSAHTEEDGETPVIDPSSTTADAFDRLDSIDTLMAVSGLTID